MTKTYAEGDRERTVLDGAALTIQNGEFVALLGRSGSGKSTLLNLLSGIDRPTSGEILVNGVRIDALSERDAALFRRQHVGFIFQFFNLIPTLTVEENLLLPLELNGRIGETEQVVARDMLAEVGLADRANAFPDRLSGGERQRVAVARALVHDPTVILADEPTGNLDADTGKDALRLIDRMARNAAKTLVIATHSREIARMADRVVTIQDGQLIERKPEAVA